MIAVESADRFGSSWDWGTVPEWVTAAFTGMALIAVLAAVSQLRIHNRQLHRELENQYLQRFWGLWDARPEKFKRTDRIKHAGSVWIRDYLTLSNDQVELRELGRVTDGTWNFWARDIASFCFDYPELAEEARKNYAALRGLLSDPQIKRAISDRSVKVYDPLKWSRFERWRQGLLG
ncbi:hypothetical protein [Citricoccus muralis]|uniref:DUF4760 domain-containing protein n=1 Tax=Citricoccus muralis TaxID=169134 RepID=A0ABY8H352_9MICC|nr:hypothetical protein [Citricoccus muralis]WFP15562.1 hypothetical protein P8192_09085 [Citricoccus muralis]